jgi:hypothetical protein
MSKQFKAYCSHTSIQKLYELACRVAAGEPDTQELAQKLIQTCDEGIAFRDSAIGQTVLQRMEDLRVDSERNLDIDHSGLVYHNESDGWWALSWAYVPDEEFSYHCQACGYDAEYDDFEPDACGCRCPECGSDNIGISPTEPPVTDAPKEA